MNRGIRYRQLLKKCGFRGWRKANVRRCALIDKVIIGDITPEEKQEFERLQKLADLYIAWKCGSSNRARNQKLSWKILSDGR